MIKDEMLLSNFANKLNDEYCVALDDETFYIVDELLEKVYEQMITKIRKDDKIVTDLS